MARHGAADGQRCKKSILAGQERRVRKLPGRAAAAPWPGLSVNHGHSCTNAPQLHPSAFPPAAEVAESLGLKHCLRLVPHDQDTGLSITPSWGSVMLAGGFFVALLRKVAPLSNKEGRERVGCSVCGSVR